MVHNTEVLNTPSGSSLCHSQFTDEQNKVFSRIPRWNHWGSNLVLSHSEAMPWIIPPPLRADVHLWCTHQPRFPDEGTEVHGAYLCCLNLQSQKVSELEFELEPFLLQNPSASWHCSSALGFPVVLKMRLAWLEVFLSQTLKWVFLSPCISRVLDEGAHQASLGPEGLKILMEPKRRW